MLSKNKIKYLKSLHSKKYRTQLNKFIIEGDKMAKECLQFPNKILEIYAFKAWLNKHSNDLPANAEIIEVDERGLKSISLLKSPNQVLMVLDSISFTVNKLQNEQQNYIYLEGIRDPGNLGTILRTSEWFGFKQIVCSEDCVELLNPKTIQASMGSFLRVDVIISSLKAIKESIPSLMVYATTMHGKNLYQTSLKTPALFIVGNEGQGVSADALRLSDEKLTIPKAEGASIDSLNAAISAALVMAYTNAKL